MMKINKNIILFLFALFFPSKLAFAGQITFSADSSVGMLWGKHYEYVYSTNSNYQQSNLLSQLEWEMYNVPTINGNISFGYKIDSIEFGIKAKGLYSFPTNSGNIYDYDWLNITISNLTDIQYSWKTNWSKSPVNQLYNWAINPEIYFCSFFNNCSISPYIGFEYYTTDFSAIGGTYSYGRSNGTCYDSYDSNNVQSGNFSDIEVLHLNREYYISWIGCSLDYKPADLLMFNFSFGISPYIYSYSIDEHPIAERPTDYLDITSGFFCAYKTNLTVNFLVTKNFQLFFNTDGQILFTTFGETHTRDHGNTKFSKATLPNSYAGNGYYYVNTSAGIKIKI